MIKVGLTGGIGSGKSYIANYFSELKIPIYNSDTRAKYLMDNDANVRKALIASFGENTFTNNELNRTYLAEIVFTNQEKLAQINSIVHPAVQNDFDNWCKQNSNAPYIIKEAAILIESKVYKNLDYLIVVSAPEKVRIKRVIKRDNLSEQEVKKRIANQISDKERIKYANYIINNDGIMLVESQVQKIDRIIKAKQ